MVMGAIIWLLMAQQVDYFLVLGVLLVSSIAGVIVHIPAGIGVLEAFLSPCFPPSRLAAGDYCRPAGLARAVLLFAAAYRHRRLSAAGESGENITRKESA
jgi:uncharacterized membrane protein YbhN (UPF0104 family)